ncbi:hypothetical protein ABPG74_014957 [Tetrahymena malaccensis]
MNRNLAIDSVINKLSVFAHDKQHKNFIDSIFNVGGIIGIILSIVLAYFVQKRDNQKKFLVQILVDQIIQLFDIQPLTSSQLGMVLDEIVENIQNDNTFFQNMLQSQDKQQYAIQMIQPKFLQMTRNV